MKKLVDIVTHPELVAQIVGEFAFMIVMSKPGDSSFEKLQALDLNDIFKKADDFFVQFTSIEELIMSDECALADKITEFLSEWQSVTDVTAVQQNIHYHLQLLDKG